jgi:hypothetical protein
MVHEQPQIESGAVQLRRRQGHPGLHAAPSARPRSLRCCRTSRARVRGDASRPSASSSRAGPARRVRSETARRSPTHGGGPPAPTPGSLPGPRAQRTSASKPLTPTWTVRSPISSPVLATPRQSCASLWVSAPSTIIDPVHLPLRLSDARRTRLAGGVPRSYQVTPDNPRPGRATANASQANGRQRESESARRRSDPLLEAGRHRPQWKQQAGREVRPDARGWTNSKRDSVGAWAPLARRKFVGEVGFTDR